MQIPQQVLNTLAGTDVLLVPPPEEGTAPTPAEKFAEEFIEPLMSLGMAVAVSPSGMSLMFNPEFHDPKALEQLAKADRLAEYVNGEGNNEKPIDPKALVKVTSRGEPVRDILVDNVQAGINAGRRNMTSENEVEVLPVTGETLTATLENRGRRPEKNMPTPTIPQRANASNLPQ